jgi:hypothetical protein
LHRLGDRLMKERDLGALLVDGGGKVRGAVRGALPIAARRAWKDGSAVMACTSFDTRSLISPSMSRHP